MKNKKNSGQIYTFYSYKGGVGRTMALANFAFIAAWNGKRVLIMDWDLEAPGVAYYFRGLLEKKTAKEIKQSAGVLDILWEWSFVTESMDSEKELKKFLRPFESGRAFSEKVKSLIDKTLFDIELTIDYIGAGAKEVNTPEPVPYEEALATFSWKEFYNEKAGGYLLENWISWAKSNYDLILVDSRTGLADVSGICTMQLPDKVVLCFILNRQNIDGVAKVASAIRAKRKEQVELKAYAMRVSQRKTSEEDDARARAISELSRIGGFSTAFMSDTLKNLSIVADDNIPFYETLSFFNTSDPETDTLSLNYLRMAKDLLGSEMVMPKFESDFIGLMRRRLEPTQATVDYIMELTSAQKDRAELELENLVEKAIQSEADGDDIKIDYIRAIIEAVKVVVEAENPASGYSLTSRILDLLRSQSEGSPEWKRLFSFELVRHFETYNVFLEADESLALLDEIDSLYSQDPTYRSTLQRVKYKLRSVSIYLESNNTESADAAIVEVEALIYELRSLGSAILEFSEEIWEAEIELLLKKSDIALLGGNIEYAVSCWLTGFESAVSKPLSEVAYRYLFEFSSRLSNARPPHLNLRSASDYAINAIKFSGYGSSYALLSNLPRLIANASVYENPLLISEITDALTSFSSFRIQAAVYYGRAGRSLVTLLESVTKLVDMSVLAKDKPQAALLFWAEVVDQILMHYNRRFKAASIRGVSHLSAPIKVMIDSFERAGIDTFKFMHMTVARSYSKNGDDSPERGV
ncbi:KGGVGR-motif variant AAA ATPase [Pseudomonas sp. NyZ201]|uniref:KGGVGR-motif variant AAA ATPase n=1 Tax=Pseudomonas sp. NyZ201 TaxID=3409857 RepID=UPI003CF78304